MKAELIDFMGSDLRVANAARVSFAKESEWDFPGEKWGPRHFEKVLKEGDKKLINYLAKHNHFTPFTHVVITMRETVPIFVARQRFKHTIGFSYNEESRRYVDNEPDLFQPDGWRKKAENKKQGSLDELTEDSDELSKIVDVHNENTLHLYNYLLLRGVAPEQARMVLPQSMYTSYYVTGSLAAWARAYKLRIDPHAQKEIQDLAKQWDEVISGIKELEHSWAALIAPDPLIEEYKELKFRMDGLEK